MINTIRFKKCQDFKSAHRLGRVPRLRLAHPHHLQLLPAGQRLQRLGGAKVVLPEVVARGAHAQPRRAHAQAPVAPQRADVFAEVRARAQRAQRGARARGALLVRQRGDCGRPLAVLQAALRAGLPEARLLL